MIDALTVPYEYDVPVAMAPEALVLRALNDVEGVRVACFAMAM